MESLTEEEDLRPSESIDNSIEVWNIDKISTVH